MPVRGRFPSFGVILVAGLVAAGLVRAQQTQETSETKDPPAEASEASPPPPRGWLALYLAGSRTYCVRWNEADLPKLKPRQRRRGPVITTFGYKYQIAVNRRGSTEVTKLFESPARKTAYLIKAPPKADYPTPRLPTAEEQKRPQNSFEPQVITRWIPENACVILPEEASFVIAPGRYDVYLGFDLLTASGQWVPLQSDFLTDVLIEKDRVTRVVGSVDNSDGVRTVELKSAGKPETPPAP